MKLIVWLNEITLIPVRWISLAESYWKLFSDFFCSQCIVSLDISNWQILYFAVFMRTLFLRQSSQLRILCPITWLWYGFCSSKFTVQKIGLAYYFGVARFCINVCFGFSLHVGWRKSHSCWPSMPTSQET